MFLVILLSVLVALLSYLLYVNYRRAETATRFCEAYLQFISALYFRFTDTRDKLKEVDRLGAFRADDEVGFVFEEIDESIDSLYNFITKYVNREENEKNEKTQN